MRRAFLPLGEVCEVQGGFAFRSGGYTERGIRIVRISDVQCGEIDSTRPRYYPADAEIPEKYLLREGDLLVTLTGHVGRAAGVIGELLPAAVNQRVARLRLRTDAVDREVLEALLTSRRFETYCIRSAQGAAQQNLGAEALRSYPVPLLSPEERAKTAAQLRQIAALEVLGRRRQEKLSLLSQTYFYDLFGDPVTNPMHWETAPLASLCDYVRDGMHGTPAFSEDGCCPFVNGSDLADGRICTEGTRSVSTEVFARHGITLPENALLLSINGTLGKVALSHGEAIVPGKSVCICALHGDSGFVRGLMETEAFRRWLHAAATGSTIPNVSLAALRSFPVILPPQALRERYAACTAQLIPLQKSARQQTEMLAELRETIVSSLLQ